MIATCSLACCTVLVQGLRRRPPSAPQLRSSRTLWLTSPASSRRRRSTGWLTSYRLQVSLAGGHCRPPALPKPCCLAAAAVQLPSCWQLAVQQATWLSDSDWSLDVVLLRTAKFWCCAAAFCRLGPPFRPGARHQRLEHGVLPLCCAQAVHQPPVLPCSTRASCPRHPSCAQPCASGRYCGRWWWHEGLRWRPHGGPGPDERRGAHGL